MAQITLEAARVNAGFTQGEIADKLKVSRATVNAWECGRVEIKPHYVFALCHVYGVTEDDIILPKVSTKS